PTALPWVYYWVAPEYPHVVHATQTAPPLHPPFPPLLPPPPHPPPAPRSPVHPPPPRRPSSPRALPPPRRGPSGPVADAPAPTGPRDQPPGQARHAARGHHPRRSIPPQLFLHGRQGVPPLHHVRPRAGAGVPPARLGGAQRQRLGHRPGPHRPPRRPQPHRPV